MAKKDALIPSVVNYYTTITFSPKESTVFTLGLQQVPTSDEKTPNKSPPLLHE